jgi:hypothetical protein
VAFLHANITWRRGSRDEGPCSGRTRLSSIEVEVVS